MTRAELTTFARVLAPHLIRLRGADGRHGQDGLPGRDGRDGLQGPPGEAGLHGKDGANGRDGIDGLGFDNAALVCEEGRGWLLRLAAGDRIQDFAIPVSYDAGTWGKATSYPAGSGVTWDGHYWIAQTQTRSQPGEGNPDWRLAVRRGKQGPQGPQGKDGAPGRDLTQMGPDGRKW